MERCRAKKVTVNVSGMSMFTAEHRNTVTACSSFKKKEVSRCMVLLIIILGIKIKFY
jgi:hypothetical protein